MMFARLERYWMDLVCAVCVLFAYLFGWLDTPIRLGVEFLRHLSIWAT